MKTASLVTISTLRHLIGELQKTVDKRGQPVRFGYVLALGGGSPKTKDLSWEIEYLEVRRSEEDLEDRKANEEALLGAQLILTKEHKPKRYASLDALERDCRRMLGESCKLLLKTVMAPELDEDDDSDWTSGE